MEAGLSTITREIYLKILIDDFVTLYYYLIKKKPIYLALKF